MRDRLFIVLLGVTLGMGAKMFVAQFGRQSPTESAKPAASEDKASQSLDSQL